MDTPILLPDRAPTLRVVPMPSDANAAGDIFGGWIMSQVDMAGSVVAKFGPWITRWRRFGMRGASCW